MHAIPKPMEPAQPVTRPHTSRTEYQHPSTHLTVTRSTSDKPQLDWPSSIPEPPLTTAYADAPARARHVSFAEVPSSSKTLPKDVGSGSLRNTQPVTNAQTSSLATGYNVSSLVPAQNSHIQTYEQADTSKSVEALSRHNVTSTENRHHTNSIRGSMGLPSVSNRPQPSLMAPTVPEPPLPIAYANASSGQGATTEPPSLFKNIPRDDGSTLLQSTLLTSNSQATGIGQKVPLTAQNQINHAQTQVY